MTVHRRAAGAGPAGHVARLRHRSRARVAGRSWWGRALRWSWRRGMDGALRDERPTGSRKLPGSSVASRSTVTFKCGPAPPGRPGPHRDPMRSLASVGLPPPDASCVLWAAARAARRVARAPPCLSTRAWSQQSAAHGACAARVAHLRAHSRAPNMLECAARPLIDGETGRATRAWGLPRTRSVQVRPSTPRPGDALTPAHACVCHLDDAHRRAPPSCHAAAAARSRVAAPVSG